MAPLSGADGSLHMAASPARRTRSTRRGADLSLALWDGVGSSWFSEAGFAKITGELREPFRSATVDFAEQPWCRAVKHVHRRALTMPDVAALPPTMKAEIRWLLQRFSQDTPLLLLPSTITHLCRMFARGQAPAGLVSLASCPPAELTRTLLGYICRTRTRLLSAHSRQQHHRSVALMTHALYLEYSGLAWWQHNVWRPDIDRRVPRDASWLRTQDMLGFTRFCLPWLREAVKLYGYKALTRKTLSWNTVIGRASSLHAKFEDFLLRNDLGGDGPVLLADPDDIVDLGVAFGDYLAERGISAIQQAHAKAAVEGLYRFLYDERKPVARTLADPRFAELDAAYTRWFPQGRSERHRAYRSSHVDMLITDQAMTEIYRRAELLGLPTDQTLEFIIDGHPRAVAGFNAPQVMRAWLLQAETGCRASEVLAAPYDCTTLLTAGQREALAIDADQADGELVAFFDHRRIKVDGEANPGRKPITQFALNIIDEQRRFVRDWLGPDGDPEYLFLRTWAKTCDQMPLSYGTYNNVLRALAKTVPLRDENGREVGLGKTHRLRHTKATRLLEAGVPLPVVQRYLGHASPEMSMHYFHATEQELLKHLARLTLVGATGASLGITALDVFDAGQISGRTDRILPNGVCLLPPTSSCDRGNACLTCTKFGTNRLWLDDLRRQRAETAALIESRKAMFLQRTGLEMPANNVWMQERVKELAALDTIIARLNDEPGTDYVAGAGAPALLPIAQIRHSGNPT
jgi:integrase